MTSPDGSITITQAQGICALKAFDRYPWDQSPLPDAENTVVGRRSVMAGCMGAVMGLSKEETIDLYRTNRYFRQMVSSMLIGVDTVDRIDKARQS